MTAKSIDELKSDLTQFNLALQQPRLYIFNHFEKLKNEIDIACQNKLESEEKQKHLDDQALIIEEVKSFEEACMSSLIDGKLDIEFVQSINETILQIEANFNNIGFTNIEIQEQISDLKLRFHKKIFLNKTMVFLTNECRFVKENTFSISQILFGSLVIIDCEFIEDDSLSYFGSIDSEKQTITPSFNSEQLKTKFLNKLIQTYLTAVNRRRYELILPILNLQLQFNQKDECDLSTQDLEDLNANTFQDLPHLKAVNLSDNYLKALNPFIFCELKDLENLNLSYNNLSHLSSITFQNLIRLSFLDLSHNRLEVLDPELFQDLINLKEINLSSTKLNHLDPKVFNGLKKLKVINLGLNNISSLDSGLFKGLVNLKDIFLNSNKLSTLNIDLFRGLMKLERIFLNKNKLVELKTGLFEGLENIKHIEIDNNVIFEN